MDVWLRRFLLCLWVLVCPMAQGHTLLTHCRVEMILAEIRDLGFERHLFHSPKSLAVRYPEVYQRVLARFEETPGWEKVVVGGLNAGNTYHSIIDRILDAKGKIAQDLRQISHSSPPGARDLRYFLESAAHSFELPKTTTKRWADRVYRARVDELRSMSKGKTLDSLEREFGVNDRFLSFAHEIRTAWGEIRAGFLMPNLIAHNIITEELNHFTPLFPKLELGQGGKDFLQTNIDLLWLTGDTLNYGEVKTYLTPLQYSESLESNWSHLVDQLDKIRRVAVRSESEWMMHVILPNGIGEKALDQLSQLGYRVHGALK